MPLRIMETEPPMGGPMPDAAGTPLPNGPVDGQSCRIERVVARDRWPGRKRRGTFVALIDDAGEGRCIARSDAFALPSPTDADIVTFHTLIADLEEDGWRPWRGPGTPLGIDRINRGYWNVGLRRPTPAQAGRNAAEGRERGDPVMEALRERAIARLRGDDPNLDSPARSARRRWQ